MSNAQQLIQWTALPNGVEDGLLRFSVFVSIDLKNPPESPNATLASYLDILDWPKTVRDRIRFSLALNDRPLLTEPALGGSPSINAQLRRVRHEPLRNAESLWQELFAPDQTPLRTTSSLRESLADSSFATFSSRRVLNIARAQYSQLRAGILPSAAPPSPPSPSFRRLMAEPAGSPDIFQEIVAKLPKISAPALSPRRNRLTNAVTSSLFEPAAGYTHDEWHLGLVLFYLESLRPGTSTPASAETLEEFRSKLATYSGYPALMRRLGLVLDFEVEVQALGSLSPFGRIAIRPEWTHLPNPSAPGVPSITVDTTNMTPWTAYALDAANGIFEADLRARTGEYPIDGPYFHGMLNLSLRDQDQPCYSLEQVDPIEEALKLNRLLRANEPQPVNRDESLSAPRSTGLALVAECIADHLTNKMSVALDNAGALAANADVTLFAEDVVRGYRPDVQTNDGQWHSLCLRSGKYRLRSGQEITILDEGWVSSTIASAGNDPSVLLVSDTLVRWSGWSLAAPIPGNRIPSDDAPAEPPASPSLQVSFTPVPGSLPRLRFGSSYRMRLRLVDLAGNGRRLDDPLAVHWRAILPDPKSPARTFERFDPLLAPDLIPRRDPDQAHGEDNFKMVIRSDRNRLPERPDERHIAPPKSAVNFAEMHGFLDGRKRGPSESFYGTLVKFDRTAPPIYDGKSYDPPYLTDPLITAILLHDVPGTNQESVTLELFDRHYRWPRVKPWRIVIEEDSDWPRNPGSAAPQYTPPLVDSKRGVLTIYLPKAEIRTIRATARIGVNDLALMGIWQEIKTSFPTNAEVFREMILRGDQWMFTPDREIQLVHAVASPLFEPMFEPVSGAPPNSAAPRLQVSRALGSSFASIATKVLSPGRSAQTLSMHARWTEWIDDGPGTTEFRTQAQTAHVFDRPLAYVDHVIPFSGQHDLGDTKHRFVEYSAIASTRFPEYLERPSATTLESSLIAVHIPNAALPPPPATLYAVPIFGWEPQVKAGSEISRTRRGGGIRIYLQRPWYKTGSDELLGVVLPNAGAANLRNVSRWGRDPLGTSVGPGPLAVVDFQGDIPARRTVAWENHPDAAIVLGHAVNYDPDRKLWFADVIIDPHRSYFPFIQLTLVRFQPWSLDNLFVSAPVIADFAQLPPDRHVSLSLDPSGPGHALKVRLTGKAMTSRNRVEVIVERGREDLIGPVRWSAAPDSRFPMSFHSTDQDGDFWELDEIPLPLGETSVQVTVLEREVYPSDDGNASRVIYAGSLSL